MARPRQPIPSYRRHKQSGQAVVTLRGLDGKRRDVLLGPWNSLESRQEYARLISEIKAAPAAAISAASTPSDATIDEILVPYLKHADQYYRHQDGTPTGQAEQIRSAIRPLARLYGDTIAREFGPLALAAVRDRMIEDKLSRKVINQRIGVIRQAFRWAVSQQLVPPSTLEGLRSLPALRAGRSKAKERPPVRPADESVIQAALPHLSARDPGPGRSANPLRRSRRGTAPNAAERYRQIERGLDLQAKLPQDRLARQDSSSIPRAASSSRSRASARRVGDR